MHFINKLALAALTLILLAPPALAGVLWEENFDNLPDWEQPYRPRSEGSPNIVCTVENPTSPYCVNFGKPPSPKTLGGDFSRFYGWYMSPAEYTPTGHGIHINSTNKRGATGKGFTTWAFYHTQNNYAAGGQLLVQLPNTTGYEEILVRMWVYYPPDYTLPSGVSVSPAQKLCHISHYMYNGLPATFFSNGGFFPTCVPNIFKYQDGVADMALDWGIRTSPSYLIISKSDYFDIPNDAYPKGNSAGTGTDFKTPGMLGDGDWHCLEYYLKNNSAPGAADGIAKLWLDGNLQQNVTNIMWREASSPLGQGIWNFVHIGGNGLLEGTPLGFEQWRAFDDVVVYTPITAADPQWATSPQDGRLPLSYTISNGATTYYVSPSGSETNSGTSPSSPWNITKANFFDFAPGDTIRLAEGDFGTTALTPKTSGSAGRPITFTSYVGAATKPVLKGGVNLSGRSYVTVDGFDVSSTGNAVLIDGGSHDIVTNCKIYSSATAWVNAVQLRNGAHYNKITDNEISQAAGSNDIINLRNDANHNLIANNTITIQNSHAAIDLEGYTVDLGGTPITGRASEWNVIRGNTLIGKYGAGALINLNANSNYNTVDGNVLKGDSTVADYCNLTNQPALHQDMFKLVGEYNIARNNVLANYPCKDAMGIEMSPYGPYDGFTNNSRYQHVYHNVVTGVGAGATPLYMFGYNGGVLADNVIKNNIIANNGGTYWQPDNAQALASDSGNIQLRDSPSSSFFTNNLIWKGGYNGPLVWLNDSYLTVAQANGNAKWSGNLNADPLLDTAFLPTTGSQAINAGADLTTITSANGSGLSFDVADAWYFCDGNDITTGDTIQVNNQLTTITDIVYGAGLAGTLKVYPAIAWTQGMGVNLPYTGTAPPIGLSTNYTVIEPPKPVTKARITASGSFSVRAP